MFPNRLFRILLYVSAPLGAGFSLLIQLDDSAPKFLRFSMVFSSLVLVLITGINLGRPTEKA